MYKKIIFASYINNIKNHPWLQIPTFRVPFIFDTDIYMIYNLFEFYIDENNQTKNIATHCKRIYFACLSRGKIKQIKDTIRNLLNSRAPTHDNQMKPDALERITEMCRRYKSVYICLLNNANYI